MDEDLSLKASPSLVKHCKKIYLIEPSGLFAGYHEIFQ